MTEKKPAAPKVGRPSLYSEELAEKICGLIEEGYSERQIAKMEGMPSTVSIWQWKQENPEFLKRSARAREISAQRFDDRRRECAEWLVNEAENRASSGEDFPKGVVEAMKSAMQELARSAALRDDSRFGDRKKVTLGGDAGAPLVVQQAQKMTTEQLLEIARMRVGDE